MKTWRDYARPIIAAVEKWGAQNQMNIAIEELAELIVAIQHFRRDRCTKAEVAEEIADAEIMLQQLLVMFGNDRVTEIRYQKTIRLKERIKK